MSKQRSTLLKLHSTLSKNRSTCSICNVASLLLLVWTKLKTASQRQLRQGQGQELHRQGRGKGQDLHLQDQVIR